jgi:predicted DCC family thiol-disulfide oxidoreductase YuxK
MVSEYQRPGTPILFFDGVCHLCNGFVDFVLSVEEDEEVRFAPIQGETASKLLDDLPDDPEGWSIVLLDDAGVHQASDAVLRLLMHMGGVWRLFGICFVIPRLLRDCVYRWIARNRYTWFGQRNACRVPDPDVEDRFLP